MSAFLSLRSWEQGCGIAGLEASITALPPFTFRVLWADLENGVLELYSASTLNSTEAPHLFDKWMDDYMRNECSVSDQPGEVWHSSALNRSSQLDVPFRKVFQKWRCFYHNCYFLFAFKQDKTKARILLLKLCFQARLWCKVPFPMPEPTIKAQLCRLTSTSWCMSWRGSSNCAYSHLWVFSLILQKFHHIPEVW